jgi:hypothetical protein
MEEDTRPCLGVRGEDQVPDPKFSSARCQDEPMLWEPDTVARAPGSCPGSAGSASAGNLEWLPAGLVRPPVAARFPLLTGSGWGSLEKPREGATEGRSPAKVGAAGAQSGVVGRFPAFNSRALSGQASTCTLRSRRLPAECTLKSRRHLSNVSPALPPLPSRAAQRLAAYCGVLGTLRRCRIWLH